MSSYRWVSIDEICRKKNLPALEEAVPRLYDTDRYRAGNPLLLCLDGNWLEGLRSMLNAGFRPTDYVVYRATLLDLPECVSLLLDFPQNLRKDIMLPNTIAYARSIETLQAYLRHGYDINGRDTSGYTCAFPIFDGGDENEYRRTPEFLKFALEHGANPHTLLGRQKNVIKMCIRHQLLEHLAVIVEAGTDLSEDSGIPGSSGYNSYLCYAVKEGAKEITHYLLSHVMFSDVAYEAAERLARSKGDSELVERIRDSIPVTVKCPEED